MKRRLAVLMLILVLVPAGGIGYMLGSPRLVEVSPEAGAVRVAAGAPLRLVFSHAMRAETVLERLSIRPEVPGEFTWEEKTLVFTPDKAWPSGAAVQVRLQAGAQAGAWPSLSIREEANWTFTVGYPRLAYLYPAEAAANLYLFDPQTGESLALTRSVGGVLEFDVSQTGALVFYSAQNAEGGSDIYRLDVRRAEEQARSGGRLPEPARVVDCGRAHCRFPQVSPDGGWLAYERAAFAGSAEPAFQRVWLLELTPSTGEPAGEPTLATDESHQTLQPDWSAQGRLSYYDSNLGSFVFWDPADGQVGTAESRTGQTGSWDPGGRLFVYPQAAPLEADTPDVSGLTAPRNSFLLRYDLGDGSTVDLTGSDQLEDTSPAFAPDGAWIAFARKDLDILRWTPGRQLWVMRPDGSEAHPLTNSPFYNHYAFAWSPGGEEIAYVRFNQTELTEPPEIWAVEFESTQARKIVTGGYAPQWIP